jgi:DNA-binding transcriptional LysR family regulator
MELEPKFLRAFRAVAERGSFTAAGKMLGTTQSAVSQYVRALEKELGVTLLIRSNKLVGVTPAGEILLQSARQILDQLERARALVREYAGGGGGRLRIGAPNEICGLLFPIIAELRRQLPKTELLVRAADNATNHERLVALALDLALMHTPARHRSVAMVQSGRDELVLLVPPDHPLASRERANAADLQDQPMVLPLRKAGEPSLWNDFLIEGGIFPKLVAETDNVELAKRLVVEGAGLTIAPRWAARAEIEQRQLSAVGLGKIGLWRNWYVAYPQAHAPGAHGRAFIRICADGLPRLFMDGARPDGSRRGDTVDRRASGVSG